jgi:hypothetical protein
LACTVSGWKQERVKNGCLGCISIKKFYLAVTDFYYLTPNCGVVLLGISDSSHAIVTDVKMPWFMLGLIYAALFFVLQNIHGPFLRFRDIFTAKSRNSV